jgi:Tol biopolymer transport system component
MALQPGTRLGGYDILGLVGAGGMGEVYRARDPRLGRDVAIKVLPADRVADEGRRRRFVQEAQAASALNHPHIITIHEIDTADDHDFIVMEYVPGKSVDALIPRQGMRLSDALRIAIPVADALAAAHARGIIHRDLKPANVMVGTDGAVKVLDFGLAKLVGADEISDVETATVTAHGTLSAPGTVAGTAAYMAPEQATGGAVDVRSDIFSFGAMLYEMVTGQRAFPGKTAVDTLAAVVRDHPKPLREVVPGIPETLERIILRCLKKDPARRFQHASDLQVDLEEAKEELESQGSAPIDGAAMKRRTWRRWAVLAAGSGLIVAVVAGAALRPLWRPPLPPPGVVQLTSERWAGAGSFSPDGTQITYASAGDDGINWDVWVRIVGETAARRLTIDRGDDLSPAWSPDGTQVAFLRQNVGGARGQFIFFFGAGFIHLVSPLGGPERRLSAFPARPSISWSPDGRWLATSKARVGNEPPGGIHLVSVASGEPRAVTFPKPPAFDVSPSFSYDGRELAYASCEGAEGNPACDVYVLSLDSELGPRGSARRLTRQALWNMGVAWTRDGRSIVYGTLDGLWRVHADGGAPPERIEAFGFAFSPTTVASRDRLAFVRRVGDQDIHRLRLGGSATPLIQSSFHEYHPQYSPDGRRVAFESNRAGAEIWLADADGSNPTRLTRGPGRRQGSPGWSPDGGSIVFDSQAEGGHVDVWRIGVDGSGLRQLTHDPADDVVPIWSRDGRVVYFTSNRTGRFEVWRVAADGGGEEQLTREGGVSPLESFDGKTLYYQRSFGTSPLFARPVAGGEERAVLPCVVSWGYAVAPRGIFHVACGTSGDGRSEGGTLLYWDAVTRRDQPIAGLQDDSIDGMSVSPDGRSLLYGRSRPASDLMLIENFR